MSHLARPALRAPMRIAALAVIAILVLPPATALAAGGRIADDVASDDGDLATTEAGGELRAALQPLPPSAVRHGQPQPGSRPPVSRLYVSIPGYNAPPTATPAPTPPAVLSAAAVSGIDASAGDGFAIAFTPGDAELPAAAARALDHAARRLQEVPNTLIALRGFAAATAGESPLKARRLALWRARAVRTALLAQGVAEKRIVLQAFDDAGGSPLTERVDVAIVAP